MVVDFFGEYYDALCGVYFECIVLSHFPFQGGMHMLMDSTPGIPAVAHDLGTTDLIATLGVTTYVLGFAFGPLVWAPMSEVRGRRPVYLISWSVFTIFQIPCALAKNPTTLIVSRLIAGTFGSSPLANAGGTLADIWMPHQRGKAMGLFAAAPFLGPVIGPIVGGFLSQYGNPRESP